MAGTGSVALRKPRDKAMRRPGSILLVSCYELGHQPLGVASPLGFLERAGYAPAVLDISVERFDREKMARARFVVISVPMHTALRLGVRLAEQVRRVGVRTPGHPSPPWSTPKENLLF